MPVSVFVFVINFALIKNSKYGIKRRNLTWFESYFSNRKQFIIYRGEQTNVKTIRYGVPQNSILGPLLFLFFVNNLQKVAKSIYLFKIKTILQNIKSELKLLAFIYLFVLYLKVDKHQIHKTVYIKKIAMYKVTIYTC